MVNESGLGTILCISYNSLGEYRFCILVILGGLQNIDTSLYESASIDGASYLYKLRRVTLPMLSPTLFFIVTVTLISAFQSFGQIDILTHGHQMMQRI